MKNYKLPIFSNATFISVGSIIFFSVLFRFYNFSFPLSLTLGGVISLIISCTYVTVAVKVLEKKLPITERKERYFEILNALYYTSEKEVLNIALIALYGGKGKLLSKKISREKEEIFSYISSTDITAKEIEDFVKSTSKNKKTVIITTKLPSDALNVLSGKVSFITAETLILKAEEKGVSLPKGIKNEKTKIPFKKRLKTVLDKKRAKKYALYGVILVFMSRFTFFPLYYIIFGGIFITLAIFIMIFDFVE